MDLLATFVLSQSMAVALCSVPVAITLPDDNTLQQEIGEIVGKAIQEMRGKDAPKVAGRGPIQAAQNSAVKTKGSATVLKEVNDRFEKSFSNSIFAILFFLTRQGCWIF